MVTLRVGLGKVHGGVNNDSGFGVSAPGSGLDVTAVTPLGTGVLCKWWLKWRVLADSCRWVQSGSN